MPRVRFELRIPGSERAKTVHALDRSTTVTGIYIRRHMFTYDTELREFLNRNLARIYVNAKYSSFKKYD
jgi:hypothetical protein